MHFRGYEFDVPEFPRLHAGEDGVPAQPPPELGAHTAALLTAAGVDQAEYEALLGSGTVMEAAPDAFAWAAVRRDA